MRPFSLSPGNLSIGTDIASLLEKWVWMFFGNVLIEVWDWLDLLLG